MSVIYRPGTSFTDVCWAGTWFVQACAAPHAVEIGWGDLWIRRPIAVELLLWLKIAAAPSGEVACIGIGPDDHAYLVTNTRPDPTLPNYARDLGTGYGENGVGLYWDGDWMPVILRDGFHYTIGNSARRQVPFPEGTSQGFRDVRPDGTIVWGDAALVTTIAGVTLARPVTRGALTVGQVDGPDRIDGVFPEGLHFASVPGRAYDPRLATDGAGAYAIVARTEQGAATNTHPPYDAIPDPEPIPERPRCTITSYPSAVLVGEEADCRASYSGGPADRATWRARPAGATDWQTAGVQIPPAPYFAYYFAIPGTKEISLRVDGPGGTDETASVRRIVVSPATPTPGRVAVAFGPSLGSPDFCTLFTEDTLWEYGHGRISAFHFYGQNILDNDPGLVGPNSFSALAEAQAFSKCKAWGVLTEMELAGEPAQAYEAEQKIAGAGGELRVLAYDDTFRGISVEDFAAWVREYRERRPQWIIGCYVAFPMASIDAILARVAAWNALGARPDFLRMDIDPNPSQRSQYTPAVHAQLRHLCDQWSGPESPRPMTLQYVVNARDGLSDAKYIEEAWAWYQRAEGIGRWDGRIVQSWAEGPPGVRNSPHNLRESDPDAFTFLLRKVLEATR